MIRYKGNYFSRFIFSHNTEKEVFYGCGHWKRPTHKEGGFHSMVKIMKTENQNLKYSDLSKLLLIPSNYNVSNTSKLVSSAIRSNLAYRKLVEIEEKINPVIDVMQESGLLISSKWFSEGLNDKRLSLAKLEADLNDCIGGQNDQFNNELVQGFWKANRLPIAKTAEDLAKYELLHPTYELVKSIYKNQHYLKQWDTNLKIDTYEGGNYVRARGQWKSFSTWSGRLTAKELPLISLPNKMNSYVLPPDNHKIISVDFSNAELRALAYHSQCKRMIDEINCGVDHHTQMGRLIQSAVGNERVINDDGLRQLSKTYTYGKLYGAGTETLRKSLRKLIPEITSVEVDKIKQVHHNLYPELERFLEQQEQSDALLTPFGKVVPLVKMNKNQKRNYSLQSIVAVLAKVLMIVASQYYSVIHHKHDETWIVAPSREPTEVVVELIENQFLKQVEQLFPGYPIHRIITFKLVGGK